MKANQKTEKVIILLSVLGCLLNPAIFGQTKSLLGQPGSILSICGTDDRVPSNDPAVGRLFFNDGLISPVPPG